MSGPWADMVDRALLVMSVESAGTSPEAMVMRDVAASLSGVTSQVTESTGEDVGRALIAVGLAIANNPDACEGVRLHGRALAYTGLRLCEEVPR